MGKVLGYITIVAPAVAVVLFVTQMIVGNELTRDAAALSHIEERIVATTWENEHMGEQIASYSSFFVLTKKAKEMGFVPTSSIVYISKDQIPVALRSDR